MVGHEKNSCPKKTVAPANNDKNGEEGSSSKAAEAGISNNGSTTGNQGTTEEDRDKNVQPKEDDSFGPWMIVQRTTRGRKKGGTNIEEGSGGMGASGSKNAQ
ncbi:hypothetical protein PIB30_047699 [Stylosanthes scabra]|uniref:Uncharacterized protein n=1 Tax=Stylosanthes scabra TaxID=79078 RepID=A0ABU6QH25_9FABA|nr:hypothetical protein [Stylosanthes scabra]